MRPTNPMKTELNPENALVKLLPAAAVGAAFSAGASETELEDADADEDEDMAVLEIEAEGVVANADDDVVCCIDVVVGDGLGDGLGGGGEPLPKSHEPVSVPTDCEAKKLNNPVEKSSPPKGHPGHCWKQKQEKKNTSGQEQHGGLRGIANFINYLCLSGF